ncbi:MAG: DEAD/DEAH box helicase [Polyangiaceae bacterium]|nr:DEAD/DEAH box helicase [Polyangiaceae bacterium]
MSSGKNGTAEDVGDDESATVTLRFVAGTLEVRGLGQSDEESGRLTLPVACEWDKRTACFRAPASDYGPVIRALLIARISYQDDARAYETLDYSLRMAHAPRPFQTEALQAWLSGGPDAIAEHRGRGVVVLPTGAGKSHLAVMAIQDRQRSTLIVVPTLDLVHQWFELLKRSFAVDIGVIGGGEYKLEPITVTTYDSAYIHMENLGNKFGFIIFDEAHHLPGEAYSFSALSCLAPYRLGLTATPERADGREEALLGLIGPISYRKEIGELAGEYLAEYDTERIVVSLSADEREEYDSEREIYLGFLRSQGIRMGSPRGWTDFIIRSSRSTEGRRAMKAYRRQRALAFAAPAKLDTLEFLLHDHRGDRMLIFTEDNATAYEISRRFLVPGITHQTKVTERATILERLKEGKYRAVVTSKVLNEGVDVPDANIAVIVSGSGSVREHVQRLGRILRRKEGKRALLYELIAANTAETGTSERRREHDAYR